MCGPRSPYRHHVCLYGTHIHFIANTAPGPLFTPARPCASTPQRTITVHAPHLRPYQPVRLRTWPAAKTCRRMKHFTARPLLGQQSHCFCKDHMSPPLLVACSKVYVALYLIMCHSVLPVPNRDPMTRGTCTTSSTPHHTVASQPHYPPSASLLDSR